MPLRNWKGASQFPLALFLTGILVPVTVIAWLAWRLLDQDQALESQRVQERLENAADLLVAALEKHFARLEEGLSTLARCPEAESRSCALELTKSLMDKAVVVVFSQAGVEGYPVGRLLYYPVLALAEEPSEEVFAEGEIQELQRADLSAALSRFTELASSANPAIRAGALLRMGRIYRKMGRIEDALGVYGQLLRLGSTRVRGLPAELLASDARRELLEEAGRFPEAQREAHALYGGLSSGRWRITGAAYRFYAERAHRALASPGDSSAQDAAEKERTALSTSAEALWEEWVSLQSGQGTPGGRKGLWCEGEFVFVLWRSVPGRMAGVAAGSRFLGKEWLAAIQPLAERQRARLALTDAEGRSIAGTRAGDSERRARRNAAETRMPWNLLVESSNPAAELEQVSHRRRLLLAGLAVMVLGLLASGYFSARALSRELEAARLKSDFVSAVSHEFRTPLTSMSHLAELFQSGRVSTEEERERYYGLLARETHRLRRLVENLLDFGRMEGGAREYRFEPVEVTELVRELVAEFQEEVAGKGYHIELVVIGTPAMVSADAEALRRALWNLLDNAVKYSPSCRTISVDVEVAQKNLTIRVRDRGLGIPLPEQAEIFKKFVRGSSSRTAAVKGTGIGLSMVQHIICAHRGSVTVRSEPGSGSTFTILLPLQE